MEKTFRTLKILNIERIIKQDLKNFQKHVDEKTAKLNIDEDKKVNKVASLYLGNVEEKKLASNTKSQDTNPKSPLSDNKICQEDVKKKSFAQNNERKYGSTNGGVPNIKNKENSQHFKCKNCVNITNVKDAEDSTKKIKQTLSPPVEVKKNKPKKVQNQLEKKLSQKEVTDKKTEKMIKVQRATTEKGSGNVEEKKVKKFPKYTDTGLGKLKKWKKNGKFLIKERKPIVEVPDPKKNKKGTNIRPFSFDIRDKELLQKKKMLIKIAAERRYEIKKWAHSPEVLRKKPFYIHKPKRYLSPDLFQLKLYTEERMKKRPKFDTIVEQKQKALKEQQLMKIMAEVKELRKSQIHHPVPIPRNVMRLFIEAKKTRNNISAEDSLTSAERVKPFKNG